MNARTQITLDPDTQRRAQAKAAEQGISFAEYVRRLLAHDLASPKRAASISMIFDLGASNAPTNVARDKHAMLDEAVWEEHKRKTSKRVVRSRIRKASKR
jgi:GH24 family phage-related lysozyme (muramidase)